MESGWHRQSNIDGEIKALPTSESILIQISFFGGGGGGIHPNKPI